LNDTRIQQLLDHIADLHIVSEADLKPAAIKTLTRLGYIHRVWIGTYALTEAGKRARKGYPGTAG